VTLSELQAAFHALATGAGGAPLAAEAFLVGSPELGAASRIGIYAGMYLARQVEALREEFPATAAVLGEGPFREVARAYVAAHPSESPDLGQLGRLLATFLRVNPVHAPRPELPDLAALEWARSEVFFEAERAPAGVDALAAIPPDRFAAARLRLAPALRLLRFERDPLPLWRAAEDGATLPPPASGPGAAAVWRTGHQVFHAALPPAEADALERALAGAPLAEVCDAFAGGAAPVEAAYGALRSWSAEGWVAAVEK
jgi:hypothetical protein